MQCNTIQYNTSCRAAGDFRDNDRTGHLSLLTAGNFEDAALAIIRWRKGLRRKWCVLLKHTNGVSYWSTLMVCLTEAHKWCTLLQRTFGVLLNRTSGVFCWSTHTVCVLKHTNGVVRWSTQMVCPIAAHKWLLNVYCRHTHTAFNCNQFSNVPGLYTAGQLLL
jgi:hypothetical protein